jgi:flagellar basal body-associated protein FliL
MDNNKNGVYLINYMGKKKERLKRKSTNKNRKKSRTGLWVFLVILALAIVGGVYIYFYLGFGSSGGIPITLTKENFLGFLKQNKIIQDLPEDADIELNIGDTVISIEGNDVSLSPNEDAEIIIEADDSLIDELNEQGYDAIKEGIEDGSIQIETDKTVKELTKKYARALARNIGLFT